MLQIDFYFLTSLLSAVIVLAMGICLFAVSMPSDAALRNYRLSRRMLGVAYIFLAAFHFAGVFIDDDIHLSTVLAPLQALMFTFALIVLINNSFVTARRLVIQLVIISVMAALNFVCSRLLSEPPVWLSCLLYAIYPCLYIYYVWIFSREYRRYKRRSDNFYAGNEHKRLQWIVRVFIMASIVGVFGGVLTENNIYLLIFIAVYTVLYTYMAIRYINYVELFHNLAPVVAVPAEVAGAEKSERIDSLIEKWIERKGYLAPEITLDGLAVELSTNSAYLSRHINSRYEQNFRSWIGTLRIGEVVRLMDAHPDMPLIEIAEQTGIPNRSSFYRQFYAVVGLTPAEYRKQSHPEK
jgi:AraC-like DNA-binding protein